MIVQSTVTGWPITLNSTNVSLSRTMCKPWTTDGGALVASM